MVHINGLFSSSSNSLLVFSSVHSNYRDKCHCERMAANTGCDNDAIILFDAFGVREYWTKL